MPNIMDSGAGIVNNTRQALQGGYGNRFAFRVLSFELKDHAVEHEIMIDYKTNHIYFKNSDGIIVSKTKELEEMLQRFLGENINPDEMGNNITIKVDGIVSRTLGPALKELLEKIIKEREESPFKANVRVATTENISLNGLQTIDDIVLKEGDRILVKNQALSSDNGIYVVKDGEPWEKPTDYNEATDTKYGMVTYVVEGTRNGGYMFAMYPKNGENLIEQITRDKYTTGTGITYDDTNRVLKLSEDFTESSGNYITRDATGRVKHIEDLKTINVITPDAPHTNFKKSQVIIDKYNSILENFKFSNIAGLDVNGQGTTDLTIIRNGEKHLLPLTSSRVVYLNNDGLVLSKVYNNTPIFNGQGNTDKLLTILAKNATLTNKNFMFTLNGITQDDEPFNLEILISTQDSITKAQITETTRTDRTTRGMLYNNTLCIDVQNLKEYKVYNKWYDKSIYDEFEIKNNEYQINKYSEVYNNTTILPSHSTFETLINALFNSPTYPIINQTVKLTYATDEQIRNITNNLTTGKEVIIDLNRLSKFLKVIEDKFKEKMDKIKSATYLDEGLVQLTNNIQDGNNVSLQDVRVPSIRVVYGLYTNIEKLTTNGLKGSYVNSTIYTMKNSADAVGPIALRGLKDDTSSDSAVTQGAFSDYKSTTNSSISSINTALLPSNLRSSIGLSNYVLSSNYNNGTGINVSNWISKLGLSAIVTGDGPANGDIVSGNTKPVNGGKIYTYIANKTGGSITDTETKMVSGQTVYNVIKIERKTKSANHLGVTSTKVIGNDTLIFVDSLLALKGSMTGTIPSPTASAGTHTITNGDYGISGKNIIFQNTFGFDTVITIR